MMASLPRIFTIPTVVAAGCTISIIFVSTKISPHHSLRPNSAKVNADVRHVHRLLQTQFDSYFDPRTVELRTPIPIESTSLSGIDVNEISLRPAPAGDRVNLNALTPPPQQPINNDAAINNGNDIDNNNINNGDIDAATNIDTTASYDIENAFKTVQAFRYTLFFFVYDSATDTFVIVHNIPGCDYGCARIYRIGSVVAYALRKNFPDRFQGADGGSEDWVVMISCGDTPRVKRGCLQQPAGLHCESANFAPILQFGSVFVDAFFPSMIAMPQPVRPFIPCFDEWQITDGLRGVCQDLQPKVDFTSSNIKSGMVFGEELGLMGDDVDYWDKLIPQIIWRGTDFHFLHTMFPGMRAPTYKLDIVPKEQSLPKDGTREEDTRWVINTLWEMGDEKLLPRWRGVLLTSEAELEAREYTKSTGEPKLPWINVKFASMNVKGIKVAVSENEEYQLLDKLGIACIGEYVNMTTQAGYKYHVDIGGGGGTTWTGTIEKLAMPGLLFHHITPAKDWFHDLLEPWTHYVPVESDLSDLRKKYDWAESHPVEAKQIAEQATEFARWMGSAEGFARLYEEYLVAPLGNILGAYMPLSGDYAGRSVLEVIDERGGQKGFTVIGRCGGRHENSCKSLF